MWHQNYCSVSLCLTFLFLKTTFSAPQQYCKPIPGSSDWPSLADWQTLNASVSGRLIAPVPPGLVCQTNSAVHNTAACGKLYTEWSDSSWHANQPFTTDYNDDSCLPSSSAPCSTEPLPAYVVNATNAADVQAGVKFAHDTGVRLIVKGTGHDYPGRSSGRHSLSIWTHNIRGVSVAMKDARAVKYGGVAAVKIAAGMRWGEIYTITAASNLTVVGGADPNVGIGGWITAAGHSPISTLYGLGADQVLEMEVVIANGTKLTINEDSHPDLFWAMRGGGGSTFAVMLSVTVRAFPTLPASIMLWSYNTTANSDTYWSLLAAFHNTLPDLSDAGAMGYYFITPNNSASNPDPSRQGMIAGAWIFPHKTPEEALSVITPFTQSLHKQNWKDQIHISNQTVQTPSFISSWLALSPPASVGTEVRLGSRLLDKKALKSSPKAIIAAFKKASPLPSTQILGHLVAGSGVHAPPHGIPGTSNSVLPAWRRAYVHLVLPRSWAYLNTTAKSLVTTHLRDVETAALKSLAPDTGAYVNEADPTEPEWQSTYWGDNYPRLLEVKRKWDVKGVFWCIPCVGYEDGWEVVSSIGVEGGVGQGEGRICRTT